MAKKWLLFIGIIAVLAVGYQAVSFYTFQRSLHRSLEMPLDTFLPFLPWTVIFYITIYFFWLPPIFSKKVSVSDYLRIITAVGIAFAVTLIIHLIIPASYPRPEISATDASTSWTEYLLSRVYSMDLPNNTFPSSHVVVAVTLMIMTYPFFKKWAHRAYASWGTLISLSTLTVKQHYVADVVTGIAVAILSSFAVRKFWPREVQKDQ